jgi:hypothetical protein
MKHLQQITQLKNLCDQVLVIGKVEHNDLDTLHEILSGDHTPHFLIDMHHNDVHQFQDFDLFIDPEIRINAIDRGARGGWSHQDEIDATISTIPLGRYTLSRDGIPLRTTVKANWCDISTSWNNRLPHKAHMDPIPVSNGWELPAIDKDSVDGGFQSMLGYNNNGIRNSWETDDWETILRDNPDVFAICESKCALWKLKKYAGGTLWSFIRSRYPYIYVFQCRNPHAGLHGTVMFCKQRPDGWIRGMGDGSERER